MDELDRMFRRLVQNARAASPEYLARPFEVAEIYHTLLPYRLNRRELGMDSVQQYDGALMRLLAGERGYLTGDADMQRAMQDELRQGSPDTSAFRAYATAPVAFAPDAVRQLERDTLTPRPSEGVRPPTAAESARAQAPTVPPVAPPVAPPLAAPSAASSAPPPPPVSVPAASAAPPPVLAPMNAGVRITGADASTASDRCPHCSGKLPEGREVAFCPHCGQNLNVRQCPACSTELEVGWKFCVTCGRNVEELTAPRT
jgi:hypothetical protein